MKRLEYLLQLHDEAQGQDAFISFALAKEYEKMEDLQRALAQYRSLQATHEDYVGLYYHLGKLLEKLGQDEEALAAYEQGMKVARAQGDNHALGELNTAKMLLED